MSTNDPLPLLPYAGTSGWSGSETSRERAEREDANGTTSQRQREVLEILEAAGERGATWAEVADRLGLHHGQVSGALSVLHRSGRISRLTMRRNRSLVYVALEHINGRPESEIVSRSVDHISDVPQGHEPVILPREIVAHIAKSRQGEPMSIPPAIADQIRAACSAALD